MIGIKFPSIPGLLLNTEDIIMEVRVLFLVDDAKNAAIGHAISATNSIGRVISGGIGH
jgi:hypothetical protein